MTSSDRIRVTHVGSLPRSPELIDMMDRHDKGTEINDDAAALPGMITKDVSRLVDEQIAVGMDVINDGEAGKIGYATYVRERLTGFTGKGRGISIWDLDEVPEFAKKSIAGLDPAVPACVGPIAFDGQAAIDFDIANLKAAAQKHGDVDLFMNAASPGVISIYLENQFYATEEEYLEAIAEAMRPEYEAIANAGFTLQIDAPDLAMGLHVGKTLLDVTEFRKRVAKRVEILNHACRNIADDKWRVHLCWGNYQGPHHHDVALKDIVDIILGLKGQGLLFESANPRHEHEWEIWKDIKIPDGKVLIPGVIDTCTNYVEHPELIEQRLLRYAGVVGKERVMAATDCGFANFATYQIVDPKIAWMKFAALVEGAQRASDKLRA
ncbi:cobalamin-independent methionine synthase II family protein [Rhizobium sp.]